MDRTQELNTSASFWLSDHMEEDGTAKVLTRNDLKEFIRVEMENKKKKIKEYFVEQHRWVER